MITEPLKINTIVSVQVIPVIELGYAVEPQFGGPTHETTYWSVYERDDKGLAHWFADVACSDAENGGAAAMMVGEMIAAFHGVPVEPQAWVKEG